MQQHQCFDVASFRELPDFRMRLPWLQSLLKGWSDRGQRRLSLPLYPCNAPWREYPLWRPISMSASNSPQILNVPVPHFRISGEYAATRRRFVR